MLVLSLLLAAVAPAPAAATPHMQKVAHHRIVRHRAARHGARRRVPVVASLRLAGCGYDATGRCAHPRSPYRLPLDEPLEPTGKARALAQTGTRCALIGQTICTHPPRTIFRVER